MKRIATAALAALSIGFVGSADAADMPVYAPTTTPVPYAPCACEQPTNWTGAYFGVEGVIVSGLLPNADTLKTSGGSFIGSDQATIPFSGYGGGLFGGFDYQLGQRGPVIGIVADADWVNSGASLWTDGFGRSDSFSPRSTNTVRAKLGLPIGNDLLAYVTGGAAFGRFNESFGYPPAIQNLDIKKAGWALGGGVDYHLIGGLFAKGEILYTNFGGVTVADVKDDLTSQFRLQDWTFKAGLDYRFN